MLSQVLANLIKTRARSMPADSYRAMISRALRMVAAVSNDSRASTSVETRPGTIFNISPPKATRTRSISCAGEALGLERFTSATKLL